MQRYGSIPRKLKSQLDAITPSGDGHTAYYPCAVALDDGEVLERVYVMEHEPYIRTWGVAPEDDRGKQSVGIERVTEIRESPWRLPVSLANELYAAGESGMGYLLFTVEFSDGSVHPYVTGGAVDFIVPPSGLRVAEARKVHPHEGRYSNPQPAPDYFWCLYQGASDATAAASSRS